MAIYNSSQPHRDEAGETDVLTADGFAAHLIVWNDEINTFDWVITALMEICEHTAEQAEQCALFIHFKGKYAVKQGSYEKLRPLCEGLLDRAISATIESEIPS